jgi:hypothetical protein
LLALLCTTGDGLGLVWMEKRAGPAHYFTGPAAAAGEAAAYGIYLSSHDELGWPAAMNHTQAAASQEAVADERTAGDSPSADSGSCHGSCGLLSGCWTAVCCQKPRCAGGRILFLLLWPAQLLLIGRRHTIPLVHVHVCLVLPCACTRLQPPQQALWRHTTTGAIYTLCLQLCLHTCRACIHSLLSRSYL